MACPQVVDERHHIQILAVAANVLNKQLWTAYKGLSLSSGVKWGLTTPHKILHRALEFGRFLKLPVFLT
jgi:hypothetical protein